MEHDFTGVVAPDVTENEKIGPKNRADDIKNDEYDRKNKGKSVMCTPKFGLINNSDSMSSVLYRAHVVV